MSGILHRGPNETCNPRFYFPSPILPILSAHHWAPRFFARMVCRGYGNKVELSAFDKDPNTQDMLTRPPFLKKEVYGHGAVDIVFSRDSNLGSTLVERIARVYTRVIIGPNDFVPRKNKMSWHAELSYAAWPKKREKSKNVKRQHQLSPLIIKICKHIIIN